MYESARARTLVKLLGRGEGFLLFCASGEAGSVRNALAGHFEVAFSINATGSRIIHS